MSDGIKIAIGIGAVAIVGYFVVTKVSAPAIVPKNTAPSNTATSFISGIVKGVSDITSIFKSSQANAPLRNIDTPFTSEQQQSIYDFRNENYSSDAERDAAILG